MALKTTAFDPAEFLDTREAQVELLAFEATHDVAREKIRPRHEILFGLHDELLSIGAHVEKAEIARPGRQRLRRPLNRPDPGIEARPRGVARVAQEAGLSRQALYRSLSKAGDPRLTTLLGVAKSLGLKLSFKAA